MPIHHVGLVVPDLAAGKEFYLAALAPLGYEIYHEIEGVVVGFAAGAPADFWLGAAGPDKPASQRQHIAFKAESREAVDQFHQAALKAGGTDNGAPGLRKQGPTYYAAYILDLDGNKIEAVHM